MRISACDCRPQTSLAGDAARQCLLITVRCVVIDCVKTSRGASVARVFLRFRFGDRKEI